MMALTTVGVPPELGPAFEKAEEVVSRYFRDQIRDPAHGTIEISGERYVLVRAAALSVEFFALVADLFGPGAEAEAEEFARSILFDLAHAVGKSDAKTFHAKMGLYDPIERLSAGPVHFAHAGWAKVQIQPESTPVASDEFYLCYDHPYAFESDAWLRAQRMGGARRSQPACIMNAGYSSGWCEQSFGLSLVAAEVLCRARGDDTCRFLMATPARIEARVDHFRKGSSPPSSRRRLAIPDFFSRKRYEDDSVAGATSSSTASRSARPSSRGRTTCSGARWRSASASRRGSSRPTSSRPSGASRAASPTTSTT